MTSKSVQTVIYYSIYDASSSMSLVLQNPDMLSFANPVHQLYVVKNATGVQAVETCRQLRHSDFFRASFKTTAIYLFGVL
jgi:hypothetical protein